jgi:hypothetical protein
MSAAWLIDVALSLARARDKTLTPEAFRKRLRGRNREDRASPNERAASHEGRFVSRVWAGIQAALDFCSAGAFVGAVFFGGSSSAGTSAGGISTFISRSSWQAQVCSTPSQSVACAQRMRYFFAFSISPRFLRKTPTK